VLGSRPLDPIALHDRLAAWYHGARLVCGFGLLLVSYRFCAEFLRLRRQRQMAFVLVAAGGGLGWLWALSGGPGLPLDFYSPEAFTFLNLYGLPHLAAARALLLGGYLLFLRGARAGDWRGAARAGLRAGIVWLLLGFVQPLYLVAAYAVLAAYIVVATLARDTNRSPAIMLASAAPAGVLSLPMVLYTAFAFRADPILAQWGRQNVLVSPEPWHYLLAWGLWLAPAALFLLRWKGAWRRSRPDILFLVAWLAVAPLLLYLPISIQRRFAEGVQLPLVCLAALGLTTGLSRLAPRTARRLLAGAVIALSLPTTLVLLAGGLLVATRPAPPVFLPRDEIEAFRWLGLHAEPGSAVLARFEVGNALPAFAPVRVYLGHGPETAFADRKQAEVQAFFDELPDPEAEMGLLRQAGIDFVVYGPRIPHERGFPIVGLSKYLRTEIVSGDFGVARVVLDSEP
jgi:hypothetical protein